MWVALETIFPVILLLSIGAGLTYWGFFGNEFADQLNRLVYWVALPAMILVRLSEASVEKGALPGILGAFFGATAVAIALVYFFGRIFGIGPRDTGTMVQASFRGNLAFVGIPILVYTFAAYPEDERAELVALAILVFGPAMIFYNLLSVVALQYGNGEGAGKGARLLFRRLVTNPLIISGVIGLLLNVTVGPLPAVPARTLDALGALSVPGALLCIGAGLVTARIRGNVKAIVLATAVKTAVLPLLALAGVWAFSLEGPHAIIVLVFAATPTAVASYVLAKQMGGNTGLASGAIALSTILSPIAFFFVLLFL